PETLDQAILRATAKQREDRFDSAAQFVNELRRAAQEAPDLPVAAALVPLAPLPAQPAPPAAAAETLAETLAIAPPVIEDVEPGFTPRPGVLRPSAAEPPAATPPAIEHSPPPVDPEETQFVQVPARPAQPPAPEPAAQAQPVPDAEVPEVLLQRAPVQRRERLARRTSRFTVAQWLVGGAGVLIVLFINVVGLWVWTQGKEAASGKFAGDLTTFIYDKLDGFKSAMALLAVVFAAIAVLTMRTAIIDNRHLAPRTYRKLRQYHRVAGWAAIWIALAVGFLTCFGIFGFGTGSWRTFLHSLLGTALVVAIFAKIAIVRYYPAQRRYLSWLGHGLLGLFFLVFLTSAVPFAWEHIHGSSSASPYGAVVGHELR
ncbi:MAG TPA: DUF6529 family protein, partial [Dehalococcoidia bacterium]